MPIRVVQLAILGLTLLTLSGCWVAAAGVGGYYYGKHREKQAELKPK